MRRSLAAAVLFCSLFPARAGAAPGHLIPPVDGTVAAGFDAPEGAYGPGHRGLDYRVPAGTPVRAAGAGVVAFAGPVGGSIAVSIDHGDGWVSTYSWLGSAIVRRGQRVPQGGWIGYSDRAHDENFGLHLGLKHGGQYVDPARHLGPLGLAGAIHLAPVAERPVELVSGDRSCRDAPSLGGRVRAPNDNLVVLVAGINTQTGAGSPPLYEEVAGRLGYDPATTFRFSYAGHRNGELHEPYQRSDTYGDLRTAAERLKKLMEGLGQRHPGRAVDLIAHSQGGVVARTYLELAADAWDPDLPRVDHLVTLATPHEGAVLATAGSQLTADSVTGGAVVDALDRLSELGLPVPGPNSPSVTQLKPGSPLLEELAREDLLFGTRGLSLTMPHDLIVPANAAELPNETHRVLSPQGAFGHSRIVTSNAALATAHAFLRDAPATCPGAWDRFGPVAGAGVSLLESGIGWAYGMAEGVLGLGAVGRARELLEVLGP